VGGAALIAVAAYPLPSELDERARAHGMLCALALRFVDPENAPFDVRSVSDFHAALAADARLSFGRLINRIKAREKATAIATPAIWEAMNGKLDPMPKGMARASMSDAFSKATSLGWFGTDDRNFRKRTWGSTLPVVHLIYSVHLALWRSDIAGRRRTLIDMLFDRALQEEIVAESSVVLPHVLKRWAIGTDDLWHFRVQRHDPANAGGTISGDNQPDRDRGLILYRV
jgi:hypothetical protein